MLKNLKIDLAQLILIQSLIATLGSLYFSEILKYPPCILCWYQRIFMYPLAFIAAVGIWKKDRNLPFFILPLSLTGTAIAAYHNLLYYNIIPESLTPCTLGISCTTVQLQLFGFLTIPLMSLFAFLMIDIFTIAYLKLQKPE